MIIDTIVGMLTLLCVMNAVGLFYIVSTLRSPAKASAPTSPKVFENPYLAQKGPMTFHIPAELQPFPEE